MKQFNINILVSTTYKDFTLIDDGIENYYLYYQDKEWDTFKESENTPQDIYKDNFGDNLTSSRVFTNEDKLRKHLPETQWIINSINTNLKELDPNSKLNILTRLLSTLKTTVKDKQTLKENIKNSSKAVRDKLLELNSLYDGKEVDYISLEEIEEETNKINENAYNEFNKLFNSYDNNWFDMLETELFDYVDNTENIFKGLINALSSLFGYSSRFIVVNGGAEVGKSEYIQTIKKLMPDFINLGSSTPASVRRQDTEAFNKKIVYLGDKGLKGTDDEEFKGLQEVFGGLITDKEFIRDIVVGNDVLQFNLKSDGLCVFYTQPYTNLKGFGAGDQYSTRSTFIIIKPVDDGLSVFLQDENKTNDFYEIHKGYIKHILNNPLDLTISDEVKTVIWQSSRDSLRTAKYLLGLFKAYCQYIQVGNPLETDVMKFLEIFKPKSEVTEIEFMVYEKLYNNLYVLKKDELESRLYDDGTVRNQYLLTQRTNREVKSFFTAKQIKTYFGNEFKRNKNLKDTIDNIPDILNNLFKAEYINRIESQHQWQNVYYIPYNKDMQK